MNTQLLQWTIQDRLAKARTAVAMSQRDVANALGVSLRTVSRLEQPSSNVTRPMILAWASVTGAPAHWIEFGDDTGDSVTSAVTHRYRGAA